MSAPDIKPGNLLRAEWPFLHDQAAIKENREWLRDNKPIPTLGEAGEPSQTKTCNLAWEWKLGTRREHEGGGFWHDECDAMGLAEFAVIHVCEMPGRFSDRVFYKRTLIDPDGVRWGGKTLEVATITKFQRWIGGWRPEIVLKEEGWLEEVA